MFDGAFAKAVQVRAIRRRKRVDAVQAVERWGHYDKCLACLNSDD